jgi:hypothetical protein
MATPPDDPKLRRLIAVARELRATWTGQRQRWLHCAVEDVVRAVEAIDEPERAEPPKPEYSIDGQGH